MKGLVVAVMAISLSEACAPALHSQVLGQTCDVDAECLEGLVCWRRQCAREKCDSAGDCLLRCPPGAVQRSGAFSTRELSRLGLECTMPRRSHPTSGQFRSGVSTGPFCKIADVQRKLDGRAAAMRACVEMQRQDHLDLAGKLAFRIEIDRTGRVETITLAEDSVCVERLTGCFWRIVAKIHFQPPQGGNCEALAEFELPPASALVDGIASPSGEPSRAAAAKSTRPPAEPDSKGVGGDVEEGTPAKAKGRNCPSVPVALFKQHDPDDQSPGVDEPMREDEVRVEQLSAEDPRCGGFDGGCGFGGGGAFGMGGMGGLGGGRPGGIGDPDSTRLAEGPTIHVDWCEKGGLVQGRFVGWYDGGRKMGDIEFDAGRPQANAACWDPHGQAGIVEVGHANGVKLEPAVGKTQDSQGGPELVGQSEDEFGGPVAAKPPACECVEEDEPLPKGKGITRPAKLKINVHLPYPDELRSLEVQGRVHLELAIGANGCVCDVKLVKGLHPVADVAAMATAWDLRFEPALRVGRPVASTVPFVFTFILE